MATYRTSAAGGSTTGTSNRTATIVPAVGDLLVVYCFVSTNTNDAPTCSDNNGGGTYSLISVQNVVIATVNHRLSIFVRDALMVNTTSTVVTVATGSNTSGAVHVHAIAGMSRTGGAAVRSKGGQDNQAAGTAAPALDQAALTANLTIVAQGSADTTTTPPASWTERQDTNFATPTIALETATRDSGFTGTTITFGAASSTTFCSHALELDGSALTFPETSTLDLFNRADESPATGWAIAISGTSNIKVLSNEAASIGSPTTYAYSYYTPSGMADPDQEAHVVLSSTLTGAPAVGVLLRWTNPNTGSENGYLVQQDSANIKIYRIDVGVFTQLGANISNVPTAGDSLGASIIGSTITIYRKIGAGAWASIGTRTDATHSGSGFVGLKIDGASHRVDNFGGGTISPGPISVTPATATLTSALFAPQLLEVTTPTTASLTLSAFAPQINLAVTPTAVSLTLATFAPTVTATAHVTVTPATATLTTSSFVPVLAETITPSTATLTVSTFAPDVLAALVITPATATLSLTTFAPLLALSLTPSTATLTATTFAPAISTGVVPGTVSLTTTAFAPSLALSLTPSTASLTTSLFSPTVNVGLNVIPGTASLSTATFVPTVTATENVTVTPDTVSLSTVGFVPTLNLSLTPPTVSLTTVQFEPTVSTTAHLTVTPDTRVLVTTTFAPVVDAGGMIVVTPDTASLTLTLTLYIPQLWVFTATGSAERTYIPVYESRLRIAEGESRIINSESSGILTVESDDRITNVEADTRVTIA